MYNIVKIVLHNRDLLFEGHNLKRNISEIVSAIVKMHEMTFVDFDIYHWMASLRKLYLVILIYFFR